MRNRYVLLADLAMFFVAVCGSFGFRFDWYFFRTRQEFIPYLVSALVLKPIAFYGFGMYRRFWRYATIDDMLALALANSAGSVAMAAVVWAGLYLGAIREFSRSVVAADWLLALVATAVAPYSWAYEFAPSVDQLTMESPAPLQRGENGRYPVPQPGIVTKREF